MKHILTFDEFVNESLNEAGDPAYWKQYNLNESYGQVLDRLQKEFNKAVESMRGTSVLNPNGPIMIWIDLGMRLQFCDENGILTKKLA